MSQYRIVTDIYFDGCIPITVYVVQKRVRSFLCHRWINIKGYEDKSRAIDLLNLLRRRCEMRKINIEEEALCAVIDYCNCGACKISARCGITPKNMCFRSRIFYDGFIKAAEILKGGEK